MEDDYVWLLLLCLLFWCIFTALRFGINVSPAKSKYLFLEMFRFFLFILSIGLSFSLILYNVFGGKADFTLGAILCVFTYIYAVIILYEITSICPSRNKISIYTQAIKPVFAVICVYIIVIKTKFLSKPFECIWPGSDGNACLDESELEVFGDSAPNIADDTALNKGQWFASSFWPAAAMFPAVASIYLGGTTYSCLAVQNKSVNKIKQTDLPTNTE